MSGTEAFFHAMAPTLTANILTMAFVYCFARLAKIDADEGASNTSGSSIWCCCSCFAFDPNRGRRREVRRLVPRLIQSANV
jgi:hypothetical protein